MGRELICVQVGQAGNQMGGRFLDVALQEHKQYSGNNFDDAMSSFFRNVDSYGDTVRSSSRSQTIQNLRARVIPIDMEQGPLRGLINGPLGNVYSTCHFVSDVSGSGNNWGTGFHVNGDKYEEEILNSLRREAEYCDSLQTFMLLHSLGGGTGSGLGTRVLQMLADHFPHVYRFATSVFPSEDSDVVTSPYNCVLATRQLIKNADCVLPIDNQSLQELAQRSLQQHPLHKDTKDIIHSVANTNNHNYRGLNQGGKAYDNMNSIVATVITNLTASMRFPGELNIDINEITTNLVPYPKLHFLLTATAPLSFGYKDSKDVHRIDGMFDEVQKRHMQLCNCDPIHDKYLAVALMARGKSVTVSDLSRNIAKLKGKLDMIHWNRDGFKMGLCSAPPIGQPYSLLSLSSNCCMSGFLFNVIGKSEKLYNVRAHTHHYTQEGVALQDFEDSFEDIRLSAMEYEDLRSSEPKEWNAQELLDEYCPVL